MKDTYKFFSDLNKKSVNINKNICNECCTVSKNLIPKYDKNNINLWVYNLLSVLIKNNIIHKDGKSVKIEDCVVIDLFHFKTSKQFPSLHTDYEWSIFNNSNSFQIWYLVENKNENNIGNMFIFLDPNNSALYTPSILIYDKNKVNVTTQKKWLSFIKPHSEIIHQFEYDKNHSYYLDIEEGGCFLMNKNVWHTSDIRGKEKKRYAINFRVVLRNKDSSINYQNVRFAHAYKRKNFVLKNNRLYNVNMFDLMNNTKYDG
jgi:hypothetical protein